MKIFIMFWSLIISVFQLFIIDFTYAFNLIYVAGPLNQTINGSIYYPYYNLNNLFGLISSNITYSQCSIYLEDSIFPFNITNDYNLKNINVTIKYYINKKNILNFFNRSLSNSFNTSLIFYDKGRLNQQDNSSLSFLNLNLIFYDSYWNTSTIINYQNETLLNFEVKY